MSSDEVRDISAIPGFDPKGFERMLAQGFVNEQRKSGAEIRSSPDSEMWLTLVEFGADVIIDPDLPPGSISCGPCGADDDDEENE